MHITASPARRAGPSAATTAGSLPALKILRAAPRGFCAGVDRAILVVERALERFGAPVYVRHEIVHNAYVVAGLRAKGAVFVAELDAVPDGRPVIFSAHGVAKAVVDDAAARGLLYIDATCPLVTKVHVEAQRLHADGRQIIVIGHKNHPEVLGTMGQVPQGAAVLIQSVEEALAFIPRNPGALAYVTQTTLSVDDTAQIIAVLKRRFPDIAGPRKEDICYATTNRQAAVKAIADRCDALIVVGATHSSNSNRLVDTARRAGCRTAYLVEDHSKIAWDRIAADSTIGVTAGASAPDVLVDELIAAARTRFDVTVEDVSVTTETMTFSLPRLLSA